VAATAPTLPRRRPPGGPAGARVRWIAVAIVAVAVLSLLIADQATYDPTAWLIWGREIVHADLSTRAGPSWKPLPVLFTTIGALSGDDGQQWLWLVVARVGTLTALAMTWRLAARLAGPVAGAIAAAGLVTASGFLSRTFRGDSEGVLVALALGAVELHLQGRRRLTFALITLTTLLRPELALFAVAYGLYLLATTPPAARVRVLAVASVAGIVVVAAWLVPEKIGSGDLFRAANRALEPVAGSPATASRPFVATFTNAVPILPWPLYATGAALVALTALERGRGRGGRLPLALAILATLLMCLVAVMAETGFTGNIRYLTLPVAITCVLGGAGAVRLAELARARLSPRLATGAILAGVLVAAPFVVSDVGRTRTQFRNGLHESDLYASLDGAIARAGGAAAFRRCGPVATRWYDVQALARALHVHEFQVALHGQTPGSIIIRRTPERRDDPRFPHRTDTGGWHFESTCAT
jgi:hypothetical protein